MKKVRDSKPEFRRNVLLPKKTPSKNHLELLNILVIDVTEVYGLFKRVV